MQRLSSEGLNRGDIRQSGKAYQAWQLTTENMQQMFAQNVLPTKNAKGENYMESHRHANEVRSGHSPLLEDRIRHSSDDANCKRPWAFVTVTPYAKAKRRMC